MSQRPLLPPPSFPPWVSFNLMQRDGFRRPRHGLAKLGDAGHHELNVFATGNPGAYRLKHPFPIDDATTGIVEC